MINMAAVHGAMNEALQRQESIPGERESEFQLMYAQTILMQGLLEELTKIAKTLGELSDTFFTHYNLD